MSYSSSSESSYSNKFSYSNIRSSRFLAMKPPNYPRGKKPSSNDCLTFISKCLSEAEGMCFELITKNQKYNSYLEALKTLDLSLDLKICTFQSIR